MDYTMMINLLWDLATGISVGLLAYGAWLCLEHRFSSGAAEERRPHAAPTQSMPHFFS
jgi:hypothetical protein